MKKLFLKLGLYSLLLFVIILIIHTVTNSGLRKSEFGNLKEWREILSGSVQADLIIQGTSRAWVQYNTCIFDSVLHTNSYNFGMDGSPFDVQFVRFQSYLKHNKAPRIIIQNVDIDLLDINENVFQKYQFLPFLGDWDFKELLLNEGVISKSDYYLPFSVYMGQPKAIQVGFEEFFDIKHYSSNKYKGFAANNTQWNGMNFELRTKCEKISWKINPKAEKLFDEFIAICKKDNIKLVLVYAPYYADIEQLVVNFNQSRAYFKKLAIDNQLAYFDYSISAISNDKKYFYNATHLNALGAENFTKILVDDIKQVISY